MEHATGNIYKLLPRAGCLISDVSSLICETIQLGLPIFFANVIKMKYSIFREFPGLSIKTADEMATRQQSLESGKAPYPHKEYMKIMGLDHEKTIYDLVCEDMSPPQKNDGHVRHAQPFKS